MFTQGHIAFRQSLPVRSDEGMWQAWYEDLPGDVRAGVLVGATGKARRLALAGLVDASGVPAGE